MTDNDVVSAPTLKVGMRVDGRPEISGTKVRGLICLKLLHPEHSI